MVDAFALQKSGNSTPFCSKIVSPVFQLVWTTSRRSHVTSSYGCTPGVVYTRSTVRPLRWTRSPSPRVLRAPAPEAVSVILGFPRLSLDGEVRGAGDTRYNTVRITMRP